MVPHLSMPHGSPRSPRVLRLRDRRVPVAVLAGVVAAGLLVSACTSGSKGNGSIASNAAHEQTSTAPDTDSPTTPSTPDAVIHTPAATTNLNPTTPVKVTVDGGKLTSVELRNPDGKAINGTLAADGSSWASSEVLGYSKAYSLKAVAQNAEGKVVQKTATIQTLTPDNMTMPYLNTTAGLSLKDGATYGVGIVPVVHFDERIGDRKAAEQALLVTATTPGGGSLSGAWFWVDSQNVHWRPQLPAGRFLPSGTHITVTAKVYGVQVGQGLYGQADQSVSFTIGREMLTVADDSTHMVTVTSGNTKRTMPTSMGMHKSVEGSNGKVSLWTMSGTYTVIGHEDPAIMSSASFGLPANSQYGYAPEKVYKATRISTDGIYLHSAPWSVWAQGNTDTSHGCLNLSPDNAAWFYQNSLVGDPVVVKNTGGPTIQIWQNGDWSVPWSEWLQGSALH